MTVFPVRGNGAALDSSLPAVPAEAQRDAFRGDEVRGGAREDNPVNVRHDLRVVLDERWLSFLVARID